MRAKFSLILFIVLLGLFMSAGVAAANSAYVDPPQDQRFNSPVGAWIVDVQPDPALGAPAVVNYASLTQDGRIMNTDQTGTVSLGEWRPVGHRQYAVTFRGQYQANDQFFSLKVCSTLTLNAAGEEFTGPFTTDIYDAGGNWVASIHGTVRATRKPIDPLK